MKKDDFSISYDWCDAINSSEGLPTWALILLIVGGVLIIGIIIIVIIYCYRKKKREKGGNKQKCLLNSTEREIVKTNQRRVHKLLYV